MNLCVLVFETGIANALGGIRRMTNSKCDDFSGIGEDAVFAGFGEWICCEGFAANGERNSRKADEARRRRCIATANLSLIVTSSQAIVFLELTACALTAHELGLLLSFGK